MSDSFRKTRVVLAKAGPSGVGQKTLGFPRTRERFRGNDDIQDPASRAFVMLSSSL